MNENGIKIDITCDNCYKRIVARVHTLGECMKCPECGKTYWFFEEGEQEKES